jgi:hypothetical protein
MTVICSQCGEEITDHVYKVQRRRIRPPTEQKFGEPINYKPDVVNPWHAGVQVGPEFDDHCQKCYDVLPSIDELFDAYKKRLDLNCA